jgi:hypothetical protein
MHIGVARNHKNYPANKHPNFKHKNMLKRKLRSGKNPMKPIKAVEKK